MIRRIDLNMDEQRKYEAIKKALDGSLFCSVNDKTVYALDEIPLHEKKSKDLDADYQKPTPQKRHITRR